MVDNPSTQTNGTTLVSLRPIIAPSPSRRVKMILIARAFMKKQCTSYLRPTILAELGRPKEKISLASTKVANTK